MVNLNYTKDVREVVIEQLLKIIDAERLIVTGSFALYKMGLVQKVNDIDIILVNPTRDTLQVLRRFQQELPAKTKADPNTSTGLCAIFLLRGCKVDIFVTDSFRERTIRTAFGYEIATVKWIVEAKKKQNRLKDWLQLKDLAHSIYSQKDFESYLNNTPIPQICNSRHEY